MQNDLSVSDDVCKSVTIQDLSSMTIGEISNLTIDEISNINNIIRTFNQRHTYHPLSPQSDQLRELNEAYNSKKLVIVLGAEVSKGCGLPNWNALLKKLQNNIHFSGNDLEDKSLIVDKFFFKLFDKSKLILARNLHRHCSFGPENNDSVMFERFVRCALYEGTKPKYTKSMAEIIRLSSFNKGEKFLDCIITYNYDDILENCLEKKDQRNYKSVYYSEIEHNGEFPIYHVHGFLPRKGNLTDKNKIILDEEAYHFLYEDPGMWNNKIQSEKFKSNKCLLVGLSLTDPNLRRLLDAAKKVRPNEEFHHIIALRPKLSNYKKNLKKLLKNDDDSFNEKINSNLKFDETVKMLKELEEKFFEEDALSLGVQTIWAENETDIGKKLKQIKLNP